MKKYSLVLKELSSLVDKIDEKEFSTLVDSIITAGHVFLAGAGRSGQMINAFANRLMHLGLSVSVVGEISAPHSRKNDLMIVGSGSGETQRLINQVKIAKNNGVRSSLPHQIQLWRPWRITCSLSRQSIAFNRWPLSSNRLPC